MRADLYLFSHGYTKSRQAAKLLIENGIRTTVVKSVRSDEGCGYGLSVSASQVDAAASILQKNGVRIVKIIRS